MLIGEYKNKLGDKNRVALPKKFRDEIGDELIIAKGYEKCLILLTPKQWDEVTNMMITSPYALEAGRDTSRFIIGSANEVKADKQGRFILPANLKEFAEVNKEVTFLGLMNRIEIWDSSKWQERSEYLGENSSLIAEKLVDLEK